MDQVERAFGVMKREWFLPRDVRNEADIDAPLPIGYGQTNSQPYTVEVMLRLLNVQEGQKVLDVGSGSGWTSALLSYLVGPNGRVCAVELVPQLVAFGTENCMRAGVKNVEFFQAGKTFGLPEKAPYDRILVSAAAGRLPQELVDQLKPGGKMVIPVKNDILEIVKREDGSLEIIDHPGFMFVPLRRAGK